MRTDQVSNDDAIPVVGTFRKEIPAAPGKRLGGWRGTWPKVDATQATAPVGTVCPEPSSLREIKYQLPVAFGSLREYRNRRKQQERIALAALGVTLAITGLVMAFRHRPNSQFFPKPAVIAVLPAKVEPVAAPRPASYVVEQGDTLGAIAHRFHVRLHDLVAANGIPKGHTKLRIGQHLVVPTASGSSVQLVTIGTQASGSHEASSGTKAAVTTKVVSGRNVDSLAKAVRPKQPETRTRRYVIKKSEHKYSAIAHHFGICTSTLLAANHLHPQDKARAGKVLRIPPADGVYYTVESGDTLPRLLRRRHISRAEFLKYNSSAKLRVHRVVFLPGTPPDLASLEPHQPRDRGYRRHAKHLGTHRGILGDLGRALSSAFHWPLSSHAISSPFGDRGRDFHPGVDIMAGTGTPIHAARGGVVVRAGWNGAYGRCVDIDHGDGVLTRYAHASRVLVKEGDRVDAGDTIGLVGRSGNATGPHLHYEVRVHGRPVNPLKTH